MTGARVQDIYRFPLKGARGQRPASLRIDPVVGIAGDRRFAIKRKPSQPDVWAAKVHFRVCMNTPQMAAQTPVFLGGPDAEAPADGIDPHWLRSIAAVLAEPHLATIDTKGTYNLVDTNPHEFGPTISFLNLASVRALQAETGWEIDPERFRMNVWYDDGEPFSELAWADSYPGRREFAVGSLRLRVQDACERCQAIEANPNTGERDLPLLEALEALLRKRGYQGSPHRGSFQVMGFLATPLTHAVVTRGQDVRLL